MPPDEPMHAVTYQGYAACQRRKPSDRVVSVPVDVKKLCPLCKQVMQSESSTAQ